MKYSKYLLQQTKNSISPEDQTKIIEAVKKVIDSQFLKDVKPEIELLKTYGVDVFKGRGDGKLSVSKERTFNYHSRGYGWRRKYFDIIGYLFKPFNSAKSHTNPQTPTQRAIWYFKNDKQWIFHDVRYYEGQIKEYKRRIERDLEELQKNVRDAEKEKISATAEWEARKAEIIQTVKGGC